MTDCRIWVRPERVFGTEEYSGWVARSKSTLRPISVTWCLNLHLSRVLTETELSSEETETESREQGQRQHGLFYPSFEKSSALCRGTAWIFRLILLYEEDPPDLRYKQLRQEISTQSYKTNKQPSNFDSDQRDSVAAVALNHYNITIATHETNKQDRSYWQHVLV